MARAEVNDDLLPGVGWQIRQEMYPQLHSVMNWYSGVIVIAWIILPWRVGWPSVSLLLWFTLCWGYARTWLFLGESGLLKAWRDGRRDAR